MARSRTHSHLLRRRWLEGSSTPFLVDLGLGLPASPVPAPPLPAAPGALGRGCAPAALAGAAAGSVRSGVGGAAALLKALGEARRPLLPDGSGTPRALQDGKATLSTRGSLATAACGRWRWRSRGQRGSRPGRPICGGRHREPRGSTSNSPESSTPKEAEAASPGSSHGPGEPLTQLCPTTSAAPGLTQAPAAPWHGRCGGARGRCSSPYPHGLLRPLLPGPSGARARLPRQQQSLVRAPRHGSHRPPRSAGPEASAHAPAHRHRRRSQAATSPRRGGLKPGSW
jgi:hypothetical protein